METFKEYKVADISEKEKELLSSTERDICKDANKDIVLIAYEKKDTSQPL